MKKDKRPEPLNFVAKHAWKYNQSKVFRDKTKYSRKQKGPFTGPFQYLMSEYLCSTHYQQINGC